jgi:hypothetical protein
MATSFGAEENLCTYVMNLVSDNMAPGSERIDAYSFLVAEFADLDFESTLFDFGEDPLDEDMAFILMRECYTEREDGEE